MADISVIEAEQFRFDETPAGEKRHYWVRYSQEELDAGKLPCTVVRGREPGATLLVMAAVHGDEYEGVRALIDLTRRLNPEHIKGTLVTVQAANMSAYLGTSRTSPADGKNLARVFPGSPAGTYTERLASVLRDKFIARADFLLDLHSGGTYYAMPPLVGYYHCPEHEVGRRSQAAAEAFGMDVIWGHDVVGPGRTLSAALEFGIPWLYTEGYGGRRIREEELRLYYEGILRLMDHLGMLTEPQLWLDGPAPPATRRFVGGGDLDQSATSQCDGFFIPSVRLLQKVAQGERIGGIFNLHGQEMQIVTAMQDGYVMMLRETPYTNKGDALFALAPLSSDDESQA